MRLRDIADLRHLEIRGSGHKFGGYTRSYLADIAVHAMPTHIIWIAYSLSNLVAVLLLWVAWKKPALARALFFLLFAWASWFNTTTALHRPEIYTGYAPFAFLDVYRRFILGFFAQHTAPLVLGIAAGQAGIALGMLAKRRLFRLGCAGGIVFLLCIAPLGLGSAFPCTALMAAGMWLLYREGSGKWLWQAFFT